MRKQSRESRPIKLLCDLLRDVGHDPSTASTARAAFSEAGSPPLCHDLIDVERGEARRRPLEHGRVCLGDLDVQRGDTTTHGLFVVEVLDRSELCLHFAKQLQRWRQDRDLLALHELLHPPIRIMIEIWEWFTGPRQVVEGSLISRDTDLRVDPRLPAHSSRLALGHGARAPRKEGSTSVAARDRGAVSHVAYAAGPVSQMDQSSRGSLRGQSCPTQPSSHL